MSHLYSHGGLWLHVRTLLDVESSIDTTKRAGNVSVVDERKVDQTVSG